MTKPHVPNTPAYEQDSHIPTDDQRCAREVAPVGSPSDPAIGSSSATVSDWNIDDEDDLFDPAELVEQVIRRLFHRLHEMEQAGGGFMAPAIAIALAPQLAELLAMRAALRVGMSFEEWMSIFFRTVDISSALASAHEEMCAFMDSVGFVWTDEPDRRPAKP